MKKLDLYSEPYSPNGNLAGAGYRRLLGRPSMDLLQTVIREGLQNVVDAADQGQPPRAAIRVRTLDDSQLDALRQRVMGDLPEGSDSAALIALSLTKERVRVFELCDFGTAGLSGPTDADTPPVGDEKLNFVNFLKNVGATRDQTQGGGTYGYGKSSLYALSDCSTIIVDSQTTCGGSAVRRLMGCHLGDAFDTEPTGSSKGRRFTGRHWWGKDEGNDRVEPVTGDAASDLSLALGLPVRESKDTGTSILVLDPSVEDEDDASLARRITTCILMNFWPRMCESTPDHKRLSVDVYVEETSIDLPSPEDFPPLDLYSQAFASLKKGADCVPITRYSKLLGQLCFKKGIRSPRHELAIPEDYEVLQSASHIALMRPVELVVRYLRGQPFADQRFEWGGVFICADDADVELAFADSEPPTHDDWVPDNLHSGDAKALVKVAMQKLKLQANEFAPRPNNIASSESSSPSLAATASRMGKFLSQVATKGPGFPLRSSTQPGKANRIRIAPPEFVGLSAGEDGSTIATFKAELFNDGSRPDLEISVIPRLVADGVKASDKDVPDELLPQVLGVSLPQHSMAVSGKSLAVGKLGGTLFIRTTVPKGTAVEVELDAESSTEVSA